MEPLTVPFPTREKLRRSGTRQESIDDLYELWTYAHEEGNKLAKELPLVFGDTPKPPITLNVARGYDGEWTLTQERGEELAAMDHHSHWQEVTNEECESFQEYFAFSDLKGWQFYMPSFLRHYLSEFPRCSWPALPVAVQSRRNLRGFSEAQLEF